MKKTEIIKVLDNLGFDKNKFAVITGAALVVQGVIENTDDIDISVTEEYYKFLLENYECVYDRTNEFDHKAYMINDIINFGIDFFPKKINIINGYQFSSIEDVYKTKKFLNRKKDKDLINKLELIIK